MAKCHHTADDGVRIVTRSALKRATMVCAKCGDVLHSWVTPDPSILAEVEELSLTPAEEGKQEPCCEVGRLLAQVTLPGRVHVLHAHDCPVSPAPQAFELPLLNDLLPIERVAMGIAPGLGDGLEDGQLCGGFKGPAFPRRLFEDPEGLDQRTEAIELELGYPPSQNDPEMGKHARVLARLEQAIYFIEQRQRDLESRFEDEIPEACEETARVVVRDVQRAIDELPGTTSQTFYETRGRAYDPEADARLVALPTKFQRALGRIEDHAGRRKRGTDEVAYMGRDLDFIQQVLDELEADVEK